MTRLAIVADDLTGALDAAAPFAARGLSTVVALQVEGLEAAIATGADIVGVSTDSRDIAPEAAREVVAQWVARLGRVPVFKKVDSRLKGNIAAELDALSFTRGLAIPAIPAFGRWSRGGKLGGFGVADPIDIAARLGPHAAKVSVPDAETDEDIAEAIAASDHDLLIGARSLAEALAARMAPDARSAAPPALAAPAICIIGSTDPITLAQIAMLRDRCPVDFRGAPDGMLLDNGPARAPVTVIQALPGRTGAESATVANRLADALLCLAPPEGATLVISGGATAQIVLHALDISVLELMGEALPGLPIARAGGFTVITKSGGFGQPGALLDLLGNLAGSMQESYA